MVKCKECGEKMTLKVKYKDSSSNEIKSKKIYCLNGVKRHQGKCCIKGSKGISEDDVNEIIYQNLKIWLENCRWKQNKRVDNKAK